MAASSAWGQQRPISRSSSPASARPSCGPSPSACAQSSSPSSAGSARPWSGGTRARSSTCRSDTTSTSRAWRISWPCSSSRRRRPAPSAARRAETAARRHRSCRAPRAAWRSRRRWRRSRRWRPWSWRPRCSPALPGCRLVHQKGMTAPTMARRCRPSAPDSSRSSQKTTSSGRRLSLRGKRRGSGRTRKSKSSSGLSCSRACGVAAVVLPLASCAAGRSSSRRNSKSKSRCRCSRNSS
mmetsp:Transcript_133598/g.386732  ORF Transcript_133598/g.386732 Transcript_133598/m.386732 type:complete len:239 (-) Transcript_133598:265-981(-)